MSQADRVLQKLVEWAALDKGYAWWAAKHYAEINPFELSDMPERLKARMLERQGVAA